MNSFAPNWEVVDWSAPVLTISVNGELQKFVLTGSARRPRWSWKGAYQATLQPGLETSESSSNSGSTVSPMPGTVLEIKVQAGDSVEAGQTLIVVEAMKMEIPVKAPSAGVISQVEVSTGDSVARGQTLVSMEEESSE